MSDPEPHLIYAGAWLAFGAFHSWAAGDRAKTLLRPKLGPAYRLTYNGVAMVQLALVLMLGAQVFAGTPPLEIHRTWAFGLTLVFVSGVGILIMALLEYDLGRFLGTAQLRWAKQGIDAPEDEPLVTGGLHRYVRHPIYFGGLLALWGRIETEFDLATAVWGSLYLGIGMVFEERKLARLYGKDWQVYAARVPALIPWKGRAL